MGSIEIPDVSPGLVLYLLNLPIMGLVWVLAFSAHTRTGLLLSPVFVLVLLLPLIGFWRKRAGREDEHLSTSDDSIYDIATDPLRHYWGLPKDRWNRNMRRLRETDGDDDQQDRD
jgi:hypothetical protein